MNVNTIVNLGINASHNANDVDMQTFFADSFAWAVFFASNDLLFPMV